MLPFSPAPRSVRCAWFSEATVRSMPPVQKPHWKACAARNACCTGCAGVRQLGKGQLDRTDGRCGDCQHQPAVAVKASDQKRRGAADWCERDLTKRGAALQCGERNIDLPQQVAGRQAVTLVAGDEVDDGYPLLATS